MNTLNGFCVQYQTVQMPQDLFSNNVVFHLAVAFWVKLVDGFYSIFSLGN